MTQGRIVGIFVAPKKGELMQALEQVEAIAGQGLASDRYGEEQGTFKKGILHVTLIEQEALEAVSRDYDIQVLANETRRNLLTRGVALNHFVGQEFQVGDVRMRGVELSEPCGYLERLTGKKVKEALTHRGGIRAEILTSGKIGIGAKVSRRTL